MSIEILRAPLETGETHTCLPSKSLFRLRAILQQMFPAHRRLASRMTACRYTGAKIADDSSTMRPWRYPI